MRPEAWLVVVSWNTEGQRMLSTITQLGLPFRKTQKDKSLILQQSGDDIERQACIMGKIIDLNINIVLVIGKLSIANENHNISNILCNAQGWITGVFVEVGEKYPGWTWTVAARLTNIPCMLAFLDNFKN